jgi:Uma2 family endonuclease
MATETLASTEQRIKLSGISWQTYERLLSELSDRRLRLTYYRGNLEIIAPSPEHELYKTIMGRFVKTLAYDE